MTSAQPRIGGQLEEAGPTHTIPAKDRFAVVALLVIATAVHGWLFARTPIPARDGLSFSRLALQLESPSRIAINETDHPTIVTVLQKAEQPPGYPFALLAISKVVRAVQPITAESPNQRNGQLGERMLVSGQIAGCIGGTLVVIPMFLLGRLLVGRFVGFAGAALFQLLPVAAHVTSDCLSEGCYLFTLLMALWLGARGLRRGGLGNFLAAGLFVGLTYLIRPEGMLVGLAIGSIVIWQGVSKAWPKSQAVAGVLALIVGTSIVAGPYMMMIGGLSNKPSEREFWNRMFFQNPRQLLHAEPKAQANGSPALFGEWASDNAGIGRVRFAISAVAMETTKSGHYAVVPLALLGVLALKRRFSIDAGSLLFLTFVVFHLTLLILFAGIIGYISERHTLPAVAVLSVFAAAGIQPLLSMLQRFLPFIQPTRDRWLMLIILAAICLPQAIRPLHSTRTGLKKAGEFLANTMQPGDIIVDPFSWSEFYAGASVTKLAPDSDPAKPHYVILPGPADPSRHDRLPKLRLAKDVAKSGDVVYQWPENDSLDQAKVLVYRTLPRGK